MKDPIIHTFCNRALTMGVLTLALGLGGATPLYAAELSAAPHDGRNGLAGSVAGLVSTSTAGTSQAIRPMKTLYAARHNGTNGISGSVASLLGFSDAHAAQAVGPVKTPYGARHNGTNGLAGSVANLCARDGTL
ncbi:MAG: hypothetical protein M0T84_04895 [Betaproteobacteria bacterium]|nr:hypothetical protein [Betaproteobacteria bacterium]